MKILPEASFDDLFDNPEKYEETNPSKTDKFVVSMVVPTIGYRIEVLRDAAIQACHPDKTIQDGGTGWSFIFSTKKDADDAKEKLLSLFQNPNFSPYSVKVSDVYQTDKEEVSEEISYDFGTVEYDISLDRIKNLGGLK